MSAFDRGILCGDGLYETIRATRGVPIWFEEHFVRLRSGARAMKLPIPLSGTRIERALFELLKRNKISEARLRIVLTRGSPTRAGDLGLPPRLGAPHKPSLLLTAAPITASDSATPMSLGVSPWRMNSDNPLAGLKTCNTLLQIFCREEAQARDFEDALLLTQRGHIAEMTRANFFFICHGKLYTPSLDTGILAGTTRDWVLAAAPNLGIPGVEGRFLLRKLSGVQACFVTSSIMGLRAVSRVGNLVMPKRMAPEFRKLLDAYEEAVADQVEISSRKFLRPAKAKRR
ncbi:MAG: aminotransferase class IV [bacterium]